MGSCTNFVEEKTLLKINAQEIVCKQGMNVIVDRTPKCHPELAGEGIEYTWDNSKSYIRGVPIGKRRRAADFLHHVHMALSQEEGANLNKNKVRKFSARARDYVAAYYILHENDDIERSNKSTHTSNGMLTFLTHKKLKTRETFIAHIVVWS